MTSHDASSEPPRSEAGIYGSRKHPAADKPNWFVRGFRAVFGYRKTSLTALVFVTIALTIAVSAIDNSLQYTVDLPEKKSEADVLHKAWDSLQKIGAHQHTYNSRNNDLVHDLLEKEILEAIAPCAHIEYDNDLGGKNAIMFAVKYLSYDSVSYYESNNLLVRVNGSDASLPALLLSAHYDSVPSSYGITDDGMGIAAMLGVLRHYAKAKQPKRTIIFNFNNNEEFGLYGATAFVSHPWFAQIKYFLNLEGTGAGGKAILFRGTDYGIVKHYSAVRYPYASSVFQQGFNNHLIHSETDYSVYKNKGGIRGLDLAFYKPRDLYHTDGDNIKNVDIKSLWHMLSCALDFTAHMVADRIDLDDEEVSVNKDLSVSPATFTSFLNYFFAYPISTLLIINVVLIVVAPLLTFVFLLLILNNRKAWNVNFVNVVKFPISVVLSVVILSFLFDVFVVPNNPFLVNSSAGLLLLLLVSTFLLLNYAFLNGLNLLLKPFKGHQHDEKLIVMIESMLLIWVALLYSTIKLSRNKDGDDHTGEQSITIVFALFALATLLGLFGWSVKKSVKNVEVIHVEDSQPLLHEDNSQQYGSNDSESYAESSSFSVHSASYYPQEPHAKKSFSYDWLVQFLIIVPISSFVLYNSGFLILDGINKTVQESRHAQEMIYTFLKGFAVIWAVPFLPFIFKFNKVFVLVLLVIFVQGVFQIGLKDAFDIANPLKLRFLQTIDITRSPATNTITVSGRLMDLIPSVLSDIPSFKDDKDTLRVETLSDGMALYSWNVTETQSAPRKPENLIVVEVLKNSSSTSDAPFGMLTGEIRIHVPNNRNCKIDFGVSDSVVKIFDDASANAKRSPVKTVIVYDDEHPANDTTHLKGPFVFKDFEGVNQLQLNKLDWDTPYHLGFQWVPETVEGSQAKVTVKKLGLHIECFWSDLDFAAKHIEGEAKQPIESFTELLHFSPNYVQWANRDRGLLSVKKYIEI